MAYWVIQLTNKIGERIEIEIPYHECKSSDRAIAKAERTHPDYEFALLRGVGVQCAIDKEAEQARLTEQAKQDRINKRAQAAAGKVGGDCSVISEMLNI